MRHNDIPINTSTILTLMQRIDEEVDGLDGVTERSINTNDKGANARKAAINRRLLFAAHLCDALKLEVMNQYHIFRGEEPPGVIPNPIGGDKDERQHPVG